MLAHIAGDDLRHQRLEGVVPAVLAGIDLAMLLHHPAHVAGLRVAQHHVLRGGARVRRQQTLHGGQRLGQLLLRRPGQRRQQRGCLVARTLLQRGKHLVAGLGELQQALPGIGGGGHAGHPPLAFKAAQDAAEVTGIKGQLTAQFGGRGLVAMRQFVQHAHLGQ